MRHELRTAVIRIFLPLVVITSVVFTASGQLPIPTTPEDFRVPGTPDGKVSSWLFSSSIECALCHGDYDTANEPYANWRGSLMGNAGRDPLFYAQMTTANQDVNGVGTYCLRCHVPFTVVTGHSTPADGSEVDAFDREGVGCHLCHTMVSPRYTPQVSPPQDEAILSELQSVPADYGNAMLVIDPLATRRGPRRDAMQYHEVLHSPFHQSAEMCGTCHDVGNPAVTKGPSGRFHYNALGEASPTDDPLQQFPLERTYTEWRLSAFAEGGVDMGGRFGGVGSPVVGTCQDCHMPKAEAQACFFGPTRPDLRRHEFAGASAWALEAIALYGAFDPDVDPVAIERGRQAAISMVQRAASLTLTQDHGLLRVRVINESGHKIPTGHIEGRRIWTNAKLVDAQGSLLREYGGYDQVDARLDESSTVVYEMRVGLSPEAAQVTGLPAGETAHMALADVIEKDTRIPPRGFDNTAFEAAGAPAVGRDYADGQYWDEIEFWIPDAAARGVVTINYQTVSREYIDTLRDGNHTDDWGNVLHALWLATDKGPPVAMVTQEVALTPFHRGDIDEDSDVDHEDLALFEDCFGVPDESAPPATCSLADFNGDRNVDCYDWIRFSASWTTEGLPDFAPCSGSPGAVPDGRWVAGSPIIVAKVPGGALQLAWDGSCASSAGDFVVYEGVLGSYASHVPVSCSTQGLMATRLVPRPESAYYLVAPATRDAEGSLGKDGVGQERPPGATSCLPRMIDPCAP